MQRKFECKKCGTFWADAAENVAEEYLFAKCPECQVAVGLYRLAGPLLNKRIEDWGAGEWILAGLVAFLGYQSYKTFTA